MKYGFLLRVALVALLACIGSYAAAQQLTKRLILKDGSYQITTKWEIQGDRVHYYSAERGEWEDVPNSLVDWDATNQYEKDRVAGKTSSKAVELEKEFEAEREEQDAKSPPVAPGLRLPPEGGVYALDTYLSEPQLVPLDQNSGDVNRHTSRNVLRAAIGSKRSIELAGPSSKIQLHAAVPAVYINLDSTEEEEATPPGKQPTELPWDRFRIVRVEVKGDRRIVGVIKTGTFGKVKQEEDTIEANAEQIQAGWIKITPKKPLPPGEYAVAEMLGKEGMNSYVWDFGAHPDAPANLAVIRPESSGPKNSSEQPAELKRR